MRALIVEDNQVMCEFLRRTLVDMPFEEVVVAHTGEEGLLRLHEDGFGLVLVDWMLPDTSGLELIRQIAGSMPPSERPQMLMMTAYATVESAIEAMKLGALDFLEKPFEDDRLIGKIQRRAHRVSVWREMLHVDPLGHAPDRMRRRSRR